MVLFLYIFEEIRKMFIEKSININQYGPYLISLRGQNVFAYRVVTEISCLGLGVINSTSGITESWVPVN